MANQQLFGTYTGKKLPKADTTNRAGGRAYKLKAKETLAQYAAVGCFGDTFYTSAKDQLDEIQSVLDQVEPEFVAKCAVYSRKFGYLKDMPAFLLAYLVTQGPEGLRLAESIFNQVIDNGRMLRNFVQIIRSGQLNRKSFGTAVKRMINNWLNNRNPNLLFNDSVGQKPSLADVIKMTHPKPTSDERRALYGYTIGQEVSFMHLPDRICEFEEYKNAEDRSKLTPPNVPFQLLTSLNLGKDEWTQIARNAKWHMTRMNLNTFLRHGVFEDKEMVELVANRLRNPEDIKAARVFPYQLMTAYLNANNEMPFQLKEALQDAMEIAVENVPVLEGNVIVCPDVSYSMTQPVTGYHGRTVASKVSCVHVAALVSAALIRKNPQTLVLPFSQNLFDLKVNPRDSVMTIATQISRLVGGGTCCELPMQYLAQKKKKVDYIIYVSDNESWMDTNKINNELKYRPETSVMTHWSAVKAINPGAKMLCIDIVPNQTTQTPNNEDILNVGGFSDNVFDLMSTFLKGAVSGSYWVSKIEELEI